MIENKIYASFSHGGTEITENLTRFVILSVFQGSFMMENVRGMME